MLLNSYFINHLSLLLFIYVAIDGNFAKLIEIKTVKEYEKIKATSPQHAIYFYPECDQQKPLCNRIKDVIAVVDVRTEKLDLDIPIYQVDCATNQIQGLCDSKEHSPSKDFFTIMFYDNHRDTTLRLQPSDTKLNDRDLVDLFLRFYSTGWRNFYVVNSAKEIRKAIETNPSRDWFVCYGDRDHGAGKSFCHEFASVHRKRSSVGVIYTDKKSILHDLKQHVGANLESRSQSSPFDVWYLECLDDEGVRCKPYQYLMDESIINAKHFAQMVRYPPVVEMQPCGSVPDLQQFQTTILYYFYRGVKLRWDAAKTQAFDIGDQLRGAAIVVVVDVDQMKDSTLNNLGISAKKDHFPQWKLRLFTLESNKAQFQEFVRVDGCPVKFVKSKLLSVYNLDHLDKTTTADDLNAVDDVDSKEQDDEVELLLQSQRDEACYFCPIDFKRVTVLTDKTYESFIQKRQTALILFWLNVDTTSRAALAATVEASTLLDTNFAPFGAVACHDWPDVCQKALVRTWPRLFAFSHGQRLREYKNVWDPKLLANSAMLFDTPPLKQLTSANEVEDFIHSKAIRLINNTNLQTVTVGFFKCEKAREIRALTEAAKQLHGQYAFGYAAGAWVKKWVDDRMGPLELPVIVTHKNNDELEKAVLMDEVEDATPESITRFVQISSRPVIASLTKLSFPSIINRKVPIIMLIGSNPRETDFFAVLRNVEECLLSRNYVCVTLDADVERNLTLYLLHAYGLHESQLPVVVNVNAKNGHVHLLTKGDSKKSIKTWLEYINSKMIKPSLILPKRKWPQKPLLHDYMKLVDNAKSQGKMDVGHEKASENWHKPVRPWGKPDIDAEDEDVMIKKMENKEKRGCSKMNSDEQTDEMQREGECKERNAMSERNDDMEKSQGNPVEKEKIISASTRKITKEILREEAKVQHRKHVDDKDEL